MNRKTQKKNSTSSWKWLKWYWDRERKRNDEPENGQKPMKKVTFSVSNGRRKKTDDEINESVFLISIDVCLCVFFSLIFGYSIDGAI